MSDFIFPKRGQIVEGEVFQVKKNVVIISFNAATEGTIYREYYDNPAPEDLRTVVKVGDKIRAKVTNVSEGDDSSVILLSRLPLIKESKLEILSEAYEEKKIIEAKVIKAQSKGLILGYEGFEMFLPYTLLDFELKDKKEELINTKLEVVIEEFKPSLRRPRIIASRRPIYEALRALEFEKRQQLRHDELETIKTGDVLTGTIDSIEKHAAFVKFKHVSGMLRISQVSHYRLNEVEDVLKIGDEVTVKVIKKEGNRLDLSMKALLPTPYEAYFADHKVGDKVSGIVVSKLPFGVIVEVSKDVKGLLHRNEYSWNPQDNFDAYLKIGDNIDVVIMSIDKKNEKFSLSKKTLEHNPWAKLKLRVGDVIETRIEEVTEDGLKVSYESVDGFIPTKEAHNDPKVNVLDYYEVGTKVNATVTDFNRNQWILKLSVKRNQQTIERKEIEKYLDKPEAETITIGDLIEDFQEDK
ncbi:MAG: S1 RNA-binding domain-containing protein [Acholeplasmataceae bacterium]